ncbi:hypothetical protein HY58_07795 [Flavihumibacter sp. ZG627]|nr:hypothetical protein HY58_07795 [Flavihumibacter sp. ZG627]
MRTAVPGDYDPVCSLLNSEQLPTSDLRPDLDHFLIAELNDIPVAVLGLDPYGKDGLLRSMIVKREFRRHGIASKLVTELESYARHQGIEMLYLVTNTAEDYFSRKGFNIITRTDVPDTVAVSAEFNGLCPASSTLMRKSI